jgi:hypothetical protein
MEDTTELIIIIAFIMGLFFLIIVGTCFGVYYLEKKSCSEKAELMDVPWDYGFFKDCNYKINGKWINSDNYIMNEPTK